MKPFRNPWVRLSIAIGIVLGGLACADTSCDCVTPLDRPMAGEHKLYDAVQARLAPSAFDFVELNLDPILETFLGPDGLRFDIPRMDDSYCVTIIWEICYDFTICRDGCTITADILSTQISPRAPNIIDLDAVVNIDGAITIRGDLDFSCTVPLHAHDKNVHATIVLPIDSRDDLMTFDVQDVQFEITDDDYSFDDCDLWIFPVDGVLNFLQEWITPMLNDQIQGQLDSTLAEQLDAARCLPEDFYRDGCPAGSSASDGFCVDGNGCLVKPLGLVGTVDVGELVNDTMPSMDAQIDLFVAPGQMQSPANDPLVFNGGLELRMIGGAESEVDACVTVPAQEPLPQPPPRMIFPANDTLPGLGPYKAAIGISDAFIDWSLYKAYLSGLLCLTIGSETSEMLNSGTLAALLGSLDRLTGGLDTPVKLVMKPGGVPYAEVGAGTFTPEGEIDQPLLYVTMPDLALDFFVRIDERFVRVVTLTQDMTLRLALDFQTDNTVMPLFGEDSIQIDNVVATNYELLAEDPSVLEDLVPTLISIALPMLTGGMEPIEIPPIEGFELDILAVQGHMPRSATPEYHEYLALFADLGMAATRRMAHRDTRARVKEISTPLRSLMSVYAPGGPQYPRVVLEVEAGEGPQAEYSYRIDGGVWHVFKPGPLLTVRDPLLAITGTHAIEVRSRSVGDYHSLDPEPARVVVEIDPREAGPSYEPLWPTDEVLEELTGQKQPLRMGTSDTEASEQEQPRIGCAAAPAGAGLLPWLLLGLALLVRRRRR
ncbi:MAG: hypothetical protein JXR96_27710 [Deltaproteobacteria bacterium]|nr:hypothetical protein [Deltaproteobacteria bacterium]